MHRKSTSLSLVGISDCGLFPSEKYPNSMEFNSLSIPMSEFPQIPPPKDGDHQETDQKTEQQEEDGEILVSSLRIKTPPSNSMECDGIYSEIYPNSMEFNSFSIPVLGFLQISPPKDGNHQEAEQETEQQEEKGEISDQGTEQKEEKVEILVSSLRIKTPPSKPGEFKEDEDGDTCTTPVSLDQRIPLIPSCPPAPRKPKAPPLMKRKAASRRILLDFSSAVESLFPPSIVTDLGGKIKKVRKSN